MIENYTQNIKLTLEQLQQIDEFQTRISNLQTETKIATKALTAVNNDLARITKEKDYKEDLLNKVDEQLVSAQAQITDLNEKSLKVSDALASLNSEIGIKTNDITAKEMELKDREDEVSKREDNCVSINQVMEQKLAEFENSKKDFNKKVAVLKEVIKDF